MRPHRRMRLVLTVLVLTAFTLITLDYRSGRGGPFSSLRGVAGSVFGPLERAAASVGRPIGDAFSSIGHLGSYKSEVARLKRENAQLQQQNRAAAAIAQQNQQLTALDHLAGQGQYRIVRANIVARGDVLGFERTATIDAGSRDHITKDMTVVDGDGLVGKIVAVGSTTSTVQLATDGAFNAGARIAGSGETGFVSGHGADPMSFELLDSTRLKVGEQLVTFGSTGNRPFVPGVPIGIITSVQPTPGALTRTALVRPFVDFDTLGVVGVVVAPPRSDPRDSLLPPKPAASSGPAPRH